MRTIGLDLAVQTAHKAVVLDERGHFCTPILTVHQQWDAGLISHKRGAENTYGFEQAYRVAWRNILDWVQAQMALLDIGMAKMEEVFLPYVINREGKTLFEYYEHRGFQLPSGEKNGEAESGTVV